MEHAVLRAVSIPLRGRLYSVVQIHSLQPTEQLLHPLLLAETNMIIDDTTFEPMRKPEDSCHEKIQRKPDKY